MTPPPPFAAAGMGSSDRERAAQRSATHTPAKLLIPSIMCPSLLRSDPQPDKSCFVLATGIKKKRGDAEEAADRQGIRERERGQTASSVYRITG